MEFNERYLIHGLAPFYRIETQAINPEPNRKVVVCASYDMCKIPSVTLSEAIRREQL
jgi:hypothetical protein